MGHRSTNRDPESAIGSRVDSTCIGSFTTAFTTRKLS